MADKVNPLNPVAVFRDAHRRLRAARSAEFRRTCQRCGNVWYVSQAQVKSEKMRLGRQTSDAMISSGSLLSGKGGATAFVLRHSAEREQAMVTSHCSSCGSATFSEEPAPLPETPSAR